MGIAAFVLGLVKGSEVNAPAEVWGKSEQDGQVWRSSQTECNVACQKTSLFERAYLESRTKPQDIMN